MKIELSKAAGMTTAEPIRNTKGATLLPDGIVLTDAVIKALAKQNIHQIDVLECSEPESTANSDEQKEYIEKLFEPFTNSTMRELKRCLLQKLI